MRALDRAASTRVVRSTPGTRGRTNAVVMVLVAVAAVAGVLAYWSAGGFRLLLPVGLLLAAAATWSGLAGLSASYSVDLRGLHKRDLWGRRFVPWSRVTTVWVGRTRLGAFNVFLFVRGSLVPVFVYTSMVGNGREVARAIIEAATREQPGVRLGGWGKLAYGEPPFGIFE